MPKEYFHLSIFLPYFFLSMWKFFIISEKKNNNANLCYRMMRSHVGFLQNVEILLQKKNLLLWIIIKNYNVYWHYLWLVQVSGRIEYTSSYENRVLPEEICINKNSKRIDSPILIGIPRTIYLKYNASMYLYAFSNKSLL